MLCGCVVLGLLSDRLRGYTYAAMVALILAYVAYAYNHF
jgi:hypothetical protein